ncbi:2-phosphosulfolactate phosphatase [Dactylosporangium sp. NPDC051484]|uniref:2-phosphosulfolactate phosphatase n=1 Tax=Dactylosporangium sp. NPDC051484 TaxID=3154942 RepID=UPI00344D10B7
MAEGVHSQPGSGARFDWGPAGAAELARVCSILVVVDVLSFSTAVDIAVGRGIRVHPFPWSDQARAYATRLGAAVAVGRHQVNADQPWSLSPAALQSAPLVDQLVLPSPNGATICSAAASTGVPVVAACLRNAPAVARWLHTRGYGTPTNAVGVIAAGELWPDGALRPCVEDLLGAAAVLDGLSMLGAPLSVEAAVSLAALAAVHNVEAAVHRCVSGQELIQRGFAEDVRLAVESGTSDTVPVMTDGESFTAA